MSNIILAKVVKCTALHMAKYKDASHDFAHSVRVFEMATKLVALDSRKINKDLVTYAAYMHDVNDSKYCTDHHPKMIYRLMSSFGADEEMSQLVDTIVNHVGYDRELAEGHTDAYKKIFTMPEMQIVQDADRLDALGAIGIARAFYFSANKNRTMANVIEHFHEKLYKIPYMMKTSQAKEIALERVKDIYAFEKSYIRDTNKN